MIRRDLKAPRRTRSVPIRDIGCVTWDVSQGDIPGNFEQIRGYWGAPKFCTQSVV